LRGDGGWEAARVIDDIFIFDNVIHVYDLSDENLNHGRQDAEVGRQHMLAAGRGGRWAGYNNGSINFQKRWTPEELYDMVFVQAPTDLAMAQVVPIFDWFNDFFAPVHAQHAMAQKYPDRVLFCGGVDPLYRGLDDALDQLEYQVKSMGATSIKFYNGHSPQSWRCDDEKLAYPMYEKCRSLGLKVLQFHKGIPFGTQNMEALSPIDLQAPARDFPDMTFIIHHLAVPYFEEVVSIGGRFPNVYLALSSNIGFYVVAPRLVQQQLGRLLMEVGSDKLLWGSEAALVGGPAPYLKAFMDLEIPEDLRSGFGYPQITREDKANILGRNFARLMGIDIEARQRALQAVPA
jgi:predicted TIM-barrel fold metal-dependent hydrolase